MRVLILSWLFEPNPTPRAIRWGAITRQLAASGHTVDVITSKAGLSTAQPIPGRTIYRVGSEVFNSLQKFAKPSTQVNRQVDNRRPSAVKSILSRSIRLLHDQTWKRIYWPDKACLWATSAYLAASRLLRRNKYDAVVTVSLPFSANLVGYFLKKKHSQLKWIVDIGDPFSIQDDQAPNNALLYRSLNAHWDYKVLATADAISVTNAIMKDVYSCFDSKIAAKTYVIPPLLDLPSRSECGFSPPPASLRKRLVFVGTLYHKIRNPGYLLSTFAALCSHAPNEFELHFVGDIGDCAPILEAAQKELGDQIMVHGRVSREIALDLQSTADVLVNIGNTTAYQLPSKLVEYTAFRKPIVNLSLSAPDSSSDFLSSHPSWFNLDASSAISSSTTEQLLAFLRTPPPINAQQIDNFLLRFSRASVTDDYLCLIRAFEAASAAA